MVSKNSPLDSRTNRPGNTNSTHYQIDRKRESGGNLGKIG